MSREKTSKSQTTVKNGVITPVTDKPIAEMRGFLRGMPITGFREKKDRICHPETGEAAKRRSAAKDLKIRRM